MPRPDTHNAHVRGRTSTRESAERSQIATEAERLFDDPAFQRALEVTEEGIINLIAASQHDGTAEYEAAEREMCRSLRTLRSIRRVISKTMQGQRLRVADFKATPPQDED